LERFAASLKEHNLILLLHSTEPVGHVYQGKGEAVPEVLYQLIERFPGLKIVLAHWGGGLPFYALMPEVKAALENVWFDSATSPFLYNKQIYGQAASLVGEDKILFGSDYPLIPQERILNEVKGLDLPEAAKALFLGGNAAKLLGI
jgi:predicted TIM-barrel fold metal-dependent hydrolase